VLFLKLEKKRGKRKVRFPIHPMWNYRYLDRVRRVSKLLYKYAVRKKHERKVKWTLWLKYGSPLKRKAFPAVFYRLGRNRSKLKRKLGLWNRSLENILTSKRDTDLIRKRTVFKPIKKFSKFPALQFQYYVAFKTQSIILKFARNFFLK